MAFYLQEPNSGELLHALERAAADSSSAIAVFAFASLGGARLLLDSEEIQGLATNRTLKLLVGVDAVTTVEPLEFLRERDHQLPGLQVRAFVHANARSLFHPKFALFASSDSGTLITGSGNLTTAGLGQVEPAGSQAGNWEAFTVTALDQQSLQEALESLRAWWEEQENHGRFRQLDDSEVLTKAIENARRWARTPSPSSPNGPTPTKKPASGAPTSAHATATVITPAFIGEIPKGGDRWAQANFHAEEFEAYFGFEGRSGDSAEIIIQSVQPDDTLDEPERRPPVRVRSRNFRVELGAGRQIPYEANANDDRPIVIFVQVGSRAFRYCLLMPSKPEYTSALALLPAKPSGRRTMRSRILDAEEIKSAWPNAPTNLFPEHSELPEI